MKGFAKDVSILKKILAGVILVSLFLAAQLAGVFYSNQLNVQKLTLVNETQAASQVIDNMKELLGASVRILNQLPEQIEDIQESQIVSRQNFRHLGNLFRRLQGKLALLDYESPMVKEAKGAARSLERSSAQLYEQALSKPMSPSQRETHEILIRQFAAEATDFLTKINLELQESSSALIAELYARRYRPLQIGSLLTFLFLLTTLTGGLLFFKNLSGSISNLNRATAKVAAGDFEYRAPILSKDELGDLTVSFNEMAKKLFESTVSREYVNSILESLPDALVLTRTDGLIVGANQAMSDAVGLPKEDIIGKEVAEFFTEDFIKPWDQDLEDGERSSFESNFLLPGGKKIPVFCSSALAKGREKARTAIYVIKNISELVRLKEQLENRNKELTAANKELEAFSYSVSHDLRAPLRSLDGFSSSLLKMYSDKLDERGKDYLGRIRESSSKMGQLIDDLLNLSRLGRAQILKQETNLSSIVEEVAKELEEAEPERTVEWVIQSEVKAMADPQLMRVVFQNLLSNAWKFTSGHSTARIEFGTHKEKNKTVYFVKDDGAGFDMAYVDKLFVPFQRLHSTGEFPGTGIGLALVNRVIHRHGGRVWAQGEIEKGASMNFTLGE